jgi:hypothetical protein
VLEIQRGKAQVPLDDTPPLFAAAKQFTGGWGRASAKAGVVVLDVGKEATGAWP